MSSAKNPYQDLVEILHVHRHVGKAFHRVLETAEDAGLIPAEGAHNRRLHEALFDYFEACKRQHPGIRVRNAIGIAVFAGIFTGLIYLEYHVLHHMPVAS